MTLTTCSCTSSRVSGRRLYPTKRSLSPHTSSNLQITALSTGFIHRLEGVEVFDLSTAVRVRDLSRRAAVCVLEHGTAFLTDVVDLLLDGQGPAGVRCACGEVHAPVPPQSGELALLAAIREQRESEWPAAREVPQGSILVRSTVWEPAFASEVKVGALLALDGGQGRRALRVTRCRLGERQHGYGASTPVVTFLLVDAESGEPGSLTVALDEPLTVGFEAPDSVPQDLAGGAA